MAQTRMRIHGLTPGNNGDNTAQAIEIRIASGENRWGGRVELAFFDAAGTQFFVFPITANVPQNLATADACGLTSVLIATQSFAAASGLLPDAVLPPAQGTTLSLLHSEAGAVCFRGNGLPDSPNINLCVAYGHPQVCVTAGQCCRGDSDCPNGGNRCQIASEIAEGKIPFTASVFGHQNGFSGTGVRGLSGCPTVGAPITGVTALQQAEPVGPGCCHDESCHRNAHLTLVHNPTWKNSRGETATIALKSSQQQGEALFRTATFNGNLRTCQTCHLPEDGFGLRPESILRLARTDPLNPLFQAEQIPAIRELENPCMMSHRGVILENVLGDPPAFRASMHLLNIKHTGPFGWSPCFGGSDNLVDFGQTAVTQHTPRVLPRNNDPNTGILLSNRAGTLEELTLMEEFQFSLKTVVNDGRGDLKGPLDGECVRGPRDGMTCGPCPGDPPVCPADQCPGGRCVKSTARRNREDNLDRLIAAFVGFCPGASPSVIAAGRDRFQRAGCIDCHLDPFLGQADVSSTGVVDHPNNADMRCSPDCGAEECSLANEDLLCENCGSGCAGCDGAGCAPTGPMQFDIRPLVDVARVKSGSAANPTLGTFFHDGAVGTLKEVIEFYQSPEASRASVSPLTPEEAVSLLAFLHAIVEVGDPAVCPPPIECGEIRRIIGQCMDDGTFQALVVLDNKDHETQSVRVNINGVPHDVPIVDRFARKFVCCQIGPMTLSLEEPAGCVAPIEVNCTADPRGACCRSDGGCGFSLLSECLADGGTFQGRGTECTANLCPEPRGSGACCVADGSCTQQTAADCAAAGGAFRGSGTECEPNVCVTLAVADPPNNAVDARQPREPASPDPSSIVIVLSFGGRPAGISRTDFAIEATGGVVPLLTDVRVAGNDATLHFTGDYPQGHWLKITHLPTGASTCVGFLPADVSGNRTSQAADLIDIGTVNTDLVACLDAVALPPHRASCALHQADLDRSGAMNPQDLIRGIDLLSESGPYAPGFNNAALPPSPCED